MSKQHRFMLIGHGNISQMYIQTLSQFPEEQAALVGVVGRNSDRVRNFAEQHHIPYYGTDLEQVAAASRATAVIIVTPNALHAEAVIVAARLGLHCLCEKPLDVTAEKQREMIETCRTHDVKLAVSYMRRFAPHLRYMKEVVDSGKLGRLMVADVTLKHFRDKAYYDSWHGTYELDGGGPFIQQGSHMVDLVLWLCGGYERVIDAVRFQLYHEIETEDHGYAIIKYNNGAIGMIEASTVSYGIMKDQLELSGTKGTIIANYDEILSHDVQGMECPSFDTRENRDNFTDLLTDFMQAIDQDRPPYVDGDSARQATELVVDIYKQSGEPINMLT